LGRKSKRTGSGAKDPGSPGANAAVPRPPLGKEGTHSEGPPVENPRRRLRSRMMIAFGVILLLALQYALAARSLMRENPTIDEVVHMPAGITYWQQRTFRLYHHNPPLFKLWAALPVLWSGPRMQEVYQLGSWKSEPPSQTTFSQSFALFNNDRYFELFESARLMMPAFAVVGGLVVFAWSSQLYGSWAGLLSLVLWVFCPNIMAHARLITSDVSAAALGAGATYLFWRYSKTPTWKLAVLSGVALGLAELSKFSMLLLYAVWPFLWAVRQLLVWPRAEWPRRLAWGAIHGLAIVAISVVVIDLGYGFEGVGRPIGSYEFGSRSLTRPVTGAMARPRSRNPLYDVTWQFRVNRFRGTWLERLPAPLPVHYLVGFDEQKLEAEGIPRRFSKAIEDGRVLEERQAPETTGEETDGYAVYLNGEMRRSGWWYYYFLTLVYKVPEGTWLLVSLSVLLLFSRKRSREAWADEVAVGTVPVVILFSMSFLTDINLGLRYVLPMAPYVFISVGKVVPWAAGLVGKMRRAAAVSIVASMALTVAASLWIHPHYLAYLNWASGGPDRMPPRLIDSNLDWGQDLVGLKAWCDANIPGQPIGLAYFGQINPSIFGLRGQPFLWFLPPARAETVYPMPGPTIIGAGGPAASLMPGYYAVSASLVMGLPWRLYDSAPPLQVPGAWAPAWNAMKFDAFGYFRLFTPIAHIGHSILIYRLTAEDVARAGPTLRGEKG
jgi:hypothetical protein